jgi:hypothetical protein
VNASYPIGESVSATYEVTSTGEGIPSVQKTGEARPNGTAPTPEEAQGGLAEIMAGAAIRILPIAFVVLMAAVAALGYLKRGVRQGGTPQAPPRPPAGRARAPPLDLFRDVPSPIPQEESVAALYFRNLREAGLSGAAHLVYRRFAAVIGLHMGIANPSLLTARELARTCTRQPYGGVFDAFVRCYERIRYAGQKGERATRGFQDSMEKTRAALEGDHP